MAEAPAETPMISRPSRTGGLAIAAAIVAFGFVGSRLLGVVRSVAIADQFGTGADVEAYFVAFRIPDLIFQVLAGATMGSAFIPVFARLWRNDSEAEAWELASKVLMLVTIATAVLCVVAFVLAPWLVPLTAPGLEENEGKAVYLTRVMLLSPLLFAVSGMITGILNARQQFLLPALAPMLYNLAIIFGAVVLAERWGINGLAAGVVIGAALHLLIQVPGLVRERMRFRPVLDWKDARVREVGWLMGPRVIGLAAVQLNFVVTIYFATKLGSAWVGALSYAWILATLPLGLFGMALSTAAFPRLADQAADGDIGELRGTVSRVLRVIMFLTIPAALGLAILAEPVTALVFERGEFTAFDTELTAGAVMFYSFGMIAQAGVEIHSRGFYALGDTRTPVVFAVVALVVNLLIAAIVWDVWEADGLALAVSVASWMEWLLLYAVYARRVGAETEGELRAIGEFAVCAGVMVVVLAVGFAAVDPETVGRGTSIDHARREQRDHDFVVPHERVALPDPGDRTRHHVRLRAIHLHEVQVHRC
jgi:putative peptidoglycan lipid II flippase